MGCRTQNLFLVLWLACRGCHGQLEECSFADSLAAKDIIDRGVVKRQADCLDSFLEVTSYIHRFKRLCWCDLVFNIY